MAGDTTATGMDALMAKVRAVRSLEAARLYFGARQFALAELLLRDYPVDGPEALAAFDMRDRALTALNIPLPQVAAARPRYLVIREWMFGFWSDVDHVLGACLTAEAAGRIPIVHWGSQSRYCSSANENAWPLFFEPVSSATLEDVRNSASSFFPPKWNKDNLDDLITERGIGPEAGACALDLLVRDEDVIVSDVHCSVAEILPFVPESHPVAGRSIPEARRIAVDRYLRPRSEIRSRVDAFAAQHFGPGPMLGIHYRGLDKFLEDAEHEEINATYPEIIERQLREDPGLKIFLLTDTDSFANLCREKYGDRIVTTSAQRGDGTVGLHHMHNDRDRHQLGAEVLVDTLLAARCERFTGLASSNVSLFVRDLKDWQAGACELKGKVRLDLPNIQTKTHAFPPREN